ncbi:hypothetical protein ACH24_05940 [Francisella persica ATCC VR-331]|uniref:Uncharacterized protein n=1 Tax=Francisella persica ATCC VR-331 TaxID=1086726 RepID=A0AAC8VEH9_9GAMM|nr:hypothetical protein ACH24_05940 [Francisella persica ATCC VR-331]ANH77395.1 hypothetical protein FSC845_02035 [Francisella persica ATCC VR-331]
MLLKYINVINTKNLHGVTAPTSYTTNNNISKLIIVTSAMIKMLSLLYLFTILATIKYHITIPMIVIVFHKPYSANTLQANKLVYQLN